MVTILPGREDIKLINTKPMYYKEYIHVFNYVYCNIRQGMKESLYIQADLKEYMYRK
jgi:hypothetical protein